MAHVGDAQEELLQQMIIADGLSRPVPMLWSDEPFPEHVFARLSSMPTLPSEEHLLPNVCGHRNLDDDHNEGRWGTVRNRFFLAQERHSFLSPGSSTAIPPSPNLVFPQDPPVESSELRPTEKDAPCWKKEWLRRKKGVEQGALERCSSDAGIPSSQKTLRGRGLRREASGVFKLICKRREPATGSDETIITRVRSEGSGVHALTEPGSKPRRSGSINGGASGARGGGAPPRRSSENQPVGLSAYYHLMRAKFPNVRGYSQDLSHTAAKGLATRDSTAPNYINRCSSADDHPLASPSTSPLTTPAAARVPHSRAALLRIPTEALLHIPIRRVASGW
jgi:hypothetical protein